MSRAALIAFVAAVLALPVYGRGRTNPHVDSTVVRSGCPACHSGHGRSRSPMLGDSQKSTCLRCHGAVPPPAGQELPAEARPAAIGSLTGKAAVHPVDEKAFSSDSDTVVCTSCHSPHRNMPESRPDKPNGMRFRAPNDPSLYENDLCLRCHGRSSRFDIASLAAGTNRSYHPISAPAAEKSRSVDPELSGKMVNCTDCHGNSDPTGPRGPHGSDVPGLLKKTYQLQDGLSEAKGAFALCYSCHDRDAVMNRSTFPMHSLHIVEKRIACATCHDPHGTLTTRALVRVAEPGRPGITPSLKTNRLAFVSDAPASGSCFLNCHGVEHGPANYGAAKVQQALRSAVPPLPPAAANPLLPANPRNPRNPRNPDGPRRPDIPLPEVP